MAEPQFALASEEEDLPRAFKREKEARERHTREHAMPRDVRPQQHVGSHASPRNYDDEFERVVASEPMGVTVTALDIPFTRLVAFFMKAVIAAIPALILLLAIFWTIGQLAQTYMPWLVKLKILIAWQ
jgi:hypothetical protein